MNRFYSQVPLIDHPVALCLDPSPISLLPIKLSPTPCDKKWPTGLRELYYNFVKKVIRKIVKVNLSRDIMISNIFICPDQLQNFDHFSLL